MNTPIELTLLLDESQWDTERDRKLAHDQIEKFFRSPKGMTMTAAVGFIDLGFELAVQTAQDKDTDSGTP